MLKSTGKKSQLEVVGLVVIVVLISLALLFYLQFSLKKGPEIKKTYTTAQMTDNMVNTLLKTSTNCNARENHIAILLSDCASDIEGIGNTECKPGTYSCDFVRSTINELLSQTLDLWNKKYRLSGFLIDLPDRPVFDYDHLLSRCEGNIDSSEAYPIPTNRGLLLVVLKVCAD